MKALRWHGRGDVRLDDVPDPTPTANQLLVEVTWCGLCGSDLKEWQAGPVVIVAGEHPATGLRPPVTMGHEFIGTVLDYGTEVEGWERGTRVALEGEMRCGRCWHCERGDYHLCEMAAYLGFNANGGLARYVTVDPAQAIRLSDDLTDDEAALLEPMAVAVHAVRRATLDLGDSVAVIGVGAVGLGVVAAARARGAGLITAIDPIEARQALAVELGADQAFTGVEQARELGSGPALQRAGGYDVVFECSGHPSSLGWATTGCRRGGVVVTVGLHGQPVAFDLNEVTMNEREIRGSLGYVRDFPRAMSLLASGAIPASRLITRKTDLEHVIEDGFRELATNGPDHIKILVAP